MRRAAALLATAMLSSAALAADYDYVTMSGKDLYARFCASCHGDAGRGDGPVAQYLTVEVPDLTLIARRHGGEYPRDRIEKIIDGRFIIGAHGTRTMPVWGLEFSAAEVGNPDAEKLARIAIGRLADYVWTLQRTAAQDRASEARDE